MEFRHPKYYAALRAEGRKLQAASAKPQADESGRNGRKSQASSSKRQAPSESNSELQASSPKQ